MSTRCMARAATIHDVRPFAGRGGYKRRGFRRYFALPASPRRRGRTTPNRILAMWKVFAKALFWKTPSPAPTLASSLLRNCVSAAASPVAFDQPLSAPDGSDVTTTGTGGAKWSELSNGPKPDSLTLGEILGKGTFGEVYHGYDGAADRDVAVKIISKKRQGHDRASMELVKQRIEHEVSMWCELQNFPSAVRLEKFYEDEDRVYLVQELCSGGTLADLVAIRGCLSEIEAAHAMFNVLSLLAYCHRRNICFCDVKPANFILSTPSPSLTNAFGGNGGGGQANTDFVKVIDFGSCEHVPEKGLRGEKGTPLYTAPEVQHSRYGLESDMWSAGVLMYFLLSGDIPFIGGPLKTLSPSALSFYIAHGELRFEGAVWDRVSEEAKDLIAKMLDRNVKKRISADEALEHLWIQQCSTSFPVMSTNPKTGTFSDICPMDNSMKILGQA